MTLLNVLVRLSSLVVELSLCGCGGEAPPGEASRDAPARLDKPASPNEPVAPIEPAPSVAALRNEPAAPSASAPRSEPAPRPVLQSDSREPRDPGDGEPASSAFDTVLVVLGNEPLDDETPTVDTVARVAKAVEFYREHPSSLLVFTGGPTAGKTSEARRMADLAIARGVPETSLRLEEKARSTSQNAMLTAALIR